jgi:hypothetical protein
VAHAQDQLEAVLQRAINAYTPIARGSTWVGISLDVLTAGTVCKF